MTKTYERLETKLIHAGEPEPRIGGAVMMPIFQSSTFEHTGESSYHDLKYARLNNTPNHLVLHQKLAALENAESAVVTSSGMAAISTSLMTLLSSGDHLLVQDCLYGGTRDFITQDLVSFGITHEFIRGDDPASWEAKMQSNTRAIYVETMTNPLLHVADLKAVVDFAQSHGITSLIDNTFASPINFRPAELGFDLSIHSGTKYLNGHSDILAGAVIGSGQLIEKIRHVLNHLGGSLSPHSCFLLHRGLKTLAVRMQYQNASGLRIARFLQDHTSVERVNYAGLEEQSDHERARSLLDGFSGMLSFDPNGDGEIAERIIRKARLPIVAPSLGGVESLITIPATTSHAGVSPHVRHELGISDSLIRLSVGLEATDDIIEDLDYAIRAVM